LIARCRVGFRYFGELFDDLVWGKPLLLLKLKVVRWLPPAVAAEVAAEKTVDAAKDSVAASSFRF
jgi:hypothetical protein